MPVDVEKAWIPGVTDYPEPKKGKLGPADWVTSSRDGAVPVPRNTSVNVLEPAFEYGYPLQGTGSEKLATDAPVEVGQSYQIEYRMPPAFQSWQRKKLLDKLNADDRIQVIWVAHWPEQRKMLVQVKVLKTNPFVVYALVGIGIALAIGLGVYMTGVGVEKLTGLSLNVGGKDGFTFKGGGLVLLALVGLGAFVYLGRSRA